MDWNSLKQKITPYIEKATPYLDTARAYGQKAVVFAEDQLQTTPLFIKSQAEYDDLLINKRTIIIAYDERDTSASQVRQFSPLWITRAFVDNATLRFISFSDSSDLCRALGLLGPFDMRVRYEGLETGSYHTLDDIRIWWQSPVYTKTETGAGVFPPSTPVDPLASQS